MTIRLQDIKEGIPDEVALAIAIAGEPVTHAVNQRHTGFVVNGGEGQLWLFDLAWHNHFRKGNTGLEYAFVRAECLDEITAATIVGFLFALHDDTKGKIQYSVAYDDIRYFDGAKWVAGEPGQGLTCATFVLEVLRHHGIEILATETWPRDGNQEWQDRMILALPLTSEEFLAQCDISGQVARYRPEEVVGCAALCLFEPITYEVARGAADDVVLELARLGKGHPPDRVSRWP